MKRFIASILFSAVAAFVLAPSIGWAKTAKECNVEYKANKEAIKGAHQKKKDFITACRAGTESIPGGAAMAAPAAPTARALSPAASGNGKTAKECNAEYKAGKAAIKANGEKKKDFIAACRAGTATAPTGAAVTTEPNAAPPPSAAPQSERRSRRTETTAPVSASESQAQSSCPGGTVVWVNTRSGVYHFKGTHNYGTTKHGTYMCETAAKTAGDHAAKNEQHP